MSEEIKATVRRVWEEVAKGNLDALDEIYATDVLRQSPGYPDTVGLEALKQGMAAFLAAYSDIQLTIDEIIIEEDTFAMRFIFKATHTGPTPSLRIPPTGKQATWTGCGIGHIVDGKIVKEWLLVDNLAILQQLGVVPPSSELAHR